LDLSEYSSNGWVDPVLQRFLFINVPESKGIHCLELRYPMGNTSQVVCSPDSWSGVFGDIADLSLRWETVRGGVQQFCGVRRNGSVLCLNVSTGKEDVRAGKAADPFVAVGVGSSHVCALRSSGEPLCWGNNDQGQLGEYQASSDSGGPANPFRDIAVYGDRSCRVNAVGGVICWGSTGSQLNDQVGGLAPAQKVVLRDDGYCVLLADGSVVCGATDIDLPVSVVDNAVDLVSSGTHTCAQLVSGGASCWGLNDQKQSGCDAAICETPTPLKLVD